MPSCKSSECSNIGRNSSGWKHASCDSFARNRQVARTETCPRIVLQLRKIWAALVGVWAACHFIAAEIWQVRSLDRLGDESGQRVWREATYWESEGKTGLVNSICSSETTRRYSFPSQDWSRRKDHGLPRQLSFLFFGFIAFLFLHTRAFLFITLTAF